MTLLERMRSLMLAALMTTTCASVAVAPAQADLANTLSGMLGSNVQVNSAGVISSSRRGGFYGGSVYVRGKVMNVQVLNFTPPSFASGCGGIDLFGGSFSMINKEQFVALLRSIAQNAAGYAFQLALKNICEQCSTIITGLQRAIQNMNEFTGNSCQLAKGVVNSTIDALEISDVKGMQGKTIQSGFQDAWNGFWGSLSTTVENLNTAGSDGTTAYEDFEGNVVWEAMKKGGVSGWFGANDDYDLMEALMTLTGTIVVSGPVNDTDGNPTRNVTPAVSGGMLTVRDLIYGNSSATMLKCSNTTRCLDMSPTTFNLRGLQYELSEAIVGEGPADTSTILYRLINGESTDADTTAVIGRLGTYGGMLLKIAEASPPGSTAPYELYDIIKDYLAYELAVLFVTDVVSAVDQAVATNHKGSAYAENWRKTDFQQAISRLNGQIASIGDTVPDPSEHLQTFISLHDYLVRQYSPLEQ